LGQDVGEGAAVAVGLGAIVSDGRGVVVGAASVAVAAGDGEDSMPDDMHASNTEDTTAKPPMVVAARRISLRLMGRIFEG
jgi:hypothetical protein